MQAACDDVVFEVLCLMSSEDQKAFASCGMVDQRCRRLHWGIPKIRFLFNNQNSGNFEENVSNQLRSIRQNGGRLKELELLLKGDGLLTTSTRSMVSTDWIREAADNLVSLSLLIEKGGGIWDNDLLPNIALCKNLTALKLAGHCWKMEVPSTALFPRLTECSIHMPYMERTFLEYVAREHNRLKYLQVKSWLGPRTANFREEWYRELHLENHKLEHFSMEYFQTRLALSTPSLRSLHLTLRSAMYTFFHSQDNPGDSLRILSAPQLEHITIEDYRDNSSVHFDHLVDALATCPVRVFHYLMTTVRSGSSLMTTLADLLRRFPKLEEVVLSDNIVKVEDTTFQDAEAIPKMHFDRRLKITLQLKSNCGQTMAALKNLAETFVNWDWESKQPDCHYKR